MYLRYLPKNLPSAYSVHIKHNVSSNLLAAIALPASQAAYPLLYNCLLNRSRHHKHLLPANHAIACIHKTTSKLPLQTESPNEPSTRGLPLDTGGYDNVPPYIS